MWRIKDGVVKIGMFGATTNGTMRDIDVAPVSLKSVTVGSIDTVDCISFNFEDKDGNELAVGPWGGTLGRDHTVYMYYILHTYLAISLSCIIYLLSSLSCIILIVHHYLCTLG